MKRVGTLMPPKVSTLYYVHCCYHIPSCCI